jgi:hypothetical protein
MPNGSNKQNIQKLSNEDVVTSESGWRQFNDWSPLVPLGWIPKKSRDWIRGSQEFSGCLVVCLFSWNLAEVDLGSVRMEMWMVLQ